MLNRRIFAGCIERLEDRLFMSVGSDPNGFTVITPSADSRLIYVSSSSGDDHNSGLSAAVPVASFKKAMSLTRDGFPDQILLHRGDTWNASFPEWTKSGRSADEPAVLGTYGTGNRPVIATGATGSAFYATGKSPVNFLVIQGLQFYSTVRDPSSPSFDSKTEGARFSGLRWYAPTVGLTIEDCSFRFYSDNLDIEGMSPGAVQNVTIRRCLSADSYNTVNHSQGLYGYDINGLSVEESVFDHNGWNESISGAGQSGFNHNVYLSSTVMNAVFRQDVIADASNNGLLVRGGADIEDNLFIDNPEAISYGASAGSMSTPGGVHGAIIGNVIAGTRALGNLAYGFGIEIANTAPGAPTMVAGNLFIGDTQHAKPAIQLDTIQDTKNPQDSVGVNDLTIQGNIINDWFRAITTDASFVNGGTGVTGFNRVTIRNNDFQLSTNYLIRQNHPYDATEETWSGNNYYNMDAGGKWFVIGSHPMTFSEWKAQIDPTGTSNADAFPDATRNVALYDGLNGGAGTAASLLATERAQSSDQWNAAYLATAVNDYLRAGFGLSPAPVAAASASVVDESTIGPIAAPNINPGIASSPGGATETYSFSVTYADAKALDPTTMASGNVHVVGPNGFDEAAILTGMNVAADAKSAVATYSITPPGGQWNSMDDGAYVVRVGAGQVRNNQGVAVAEGAIGGFAVSLPIDVAGTPGNDRIVLRARKGQLFISINGVKSVRSLTDVPGVRVFGGDGNDVITAAAGVPAGLLDGGAGNDTIRGSNGNDTLAGDEGNDVLVAGPGRNVLIGGAGNDRLVGGAGADILSGGDGDDILRGGGGDNVLVGGNGFDRLVGGAKNDLLIGGVGSVDDANSLLGVLNAWATGEAYTTRIARLAPAAGMPVVLGGVTFSDDSIADKLAGGGGLNWYISSGDLAFHMKATEILTAF